MMNSVARSLGIDNLASGYNLMGERVFIIFEAEIFVVVHDHNIEWDVETYELPSNIDIRLGLVFNTVEYYKNIKIAIVPRFATGN